MATAASPPSIASAEGGWMKARVRALPATLSRNHWLALGLVATVLLAVLAALSLAGIFEHSTRRDAVAAYIDDVNAVQRTSAAERQTVDNTYQKIRADPKLFVTSASDLSRSARSLHVFDTHLRALTPPPEAAKLHRKLIALSAAEATFAVEIARLGRYLPALSEERRGVGVAGSNLQRALAGSAQKGKQAQAFDDFAGAVSKAAKPLRDAPVPASLAPVKSEELRRISDLSTTSIRLATALRQGKPADVQQLVRDFGRVAAGNGNAVERRAVIAFDRQARRIASLRVEIAQERTKLDRSVG
jgi:hypothetical protein